MNNHPVVNRVIFICSVTFAFVLHALIFALPASQDLPDPAPQAGMLVSYAPRIADAVESGSLIADRIVPATRRTSETAAPAGRDTGAALSTVTGTSSRAASQASIQAAFRQRIESLKTYPPLARSSGMEGTVRLKVILDEYGNLVSLKMLSTSGYWLLDDAADKLVRSALPFRHNTPSFTCEFSISYRLTDGR